MQLGCCHVRGQFNYGVVLGFLCAFYASFMLPLSRRKKSNDISNKSVLALLLLKLRLQLLLICLLPPLLLLVFGIMMMMKVIVMILIVAISLKNHTKIYSIIVIGIMLTLIIYNKLETYSASSLIYIDKYSTNIR